MPDEDEQVAALRRTIKVKDGEDLVTEGVKASSGQSTWNEQSILECLLQGRRHPDPVWTLDDLDTFFKSYSRPVQIYKPIAEPGGPRHVIWCNDYALLKHGRPRTAEEVQAWFQAAEPEWAAASISALGMLHSLLQVQRRQLKVSINITSELEQSWVKLPEDLFGVLRMEALDVSLNGKVEGCYLEYIERDLDLTELRAAAITNFSPIHSYLFSRAGELLYATANASLKLKAAGHDDIKKFTLSDLLQSEGQSQPEMAAKAIRAICKDEAKHHCITLANTLPNGSTRHSLYEMWPARDPALALQASILVSSFDVTHQKETELELQNLKNELLKHNQDLQWKVEEGNKQQDALKARLKDAMKLHMAPRMQLDTSSAIDRTVNLLDGLLEGQMPATEDIVALRNTLLSSPDLRQVSNLKKQLRGQANLSKDASQSLVSLLQDNHRASVRLADQLASPNGSGQGTPRQKSSRMLSSNVLVSSIASMEPHGGINARAGMRSSLRKSMLNCVKVPAPASSIRPDIERMLEDASFDWGYDMLALDQATDGHALSSLGYYLLQRNGLLDRLNLSEESLASCLKAVESGYRDDNQYHNRIHAACVLHTTHMLVTCPEGLRAANIVHDTLEFAMYMAAICHDYEHPGVNNDFLVKCHHPLALCYNDKSPLENYHASAAFSVLSKYLDSGFDKMDEELDLVVRSTMIELILATDMKQHFGLVARLQGAFQTGAFTSTQMSLASSLEPGLESQYDKTCLSAEHRLLVAQIALKCADVGHLALPEHLHKLWVERLQQEFFSQGDQERDKGMSVSALMDRTKTSKLSSSQVGFFEVVALPLFRCMATVVPGARSMLDGSIKNYMMWRLDSEQD